MSFKDKLPKRRKVGHWFAPVWVALVLEDTFELLNWLPNPEASWSGVIVGGLAALGVLALPKTTDTEKTEIKV